MDLAVSSYSFTHWLLFFYIYSFIGWIFESVYVSFLKRRPVNRGFLRGPFLPLYGTGAIMLLIVTIPFKNNMFLAFLAGCVSATVLEFVTGECMEALFKVRYWDYSKHKFNYKGHICLSSTIAWGFMTLLLVYVIHRPIETFVLNLPHPVIMAATYIITIGISVDAALSIKAALDLRSILEKMTEIKKNIGAVEQRAADLVSDWKKQQEKQHKGLGEYVKGLAERLEAAVENLGKRENAPAGSDVELESLKQRAGDLKDQVTRLRGKLGKDSIGLLKNNPTAVSKHFHDALEELKKGDY